MDRQSCARFTNKESQMNREARKYTPAEFIEKLKQPVDSPKTNAFIGMLQAAQDDRQLLFAMGVSCANWVHVPIERIESIEQITVVPCKDHTHPLVRLTLNAPETEEAMMYAALAQSNAFFSTPAQPLEGMRSNDSVPFRNFGAIRNKVPLANSGPDAWFPCWSRCMDDLLDFAIQQPPDQFKFWSSLAYQLCSQICP
jgi:hypothetical protein